jgi:hypothetical protein
MCLKISSPQYYILEYENYLVGLKSFKFHKSGKFFVISGFFKEYAYKFEKHEKGLIAIPNNTIQPINYEILTKKAKGYFDFIKIQKNLLLGYHIFKFFKYDSLQSYFDTSKFFEEDEILLPILFKQDWIQVDGISDLASETFIIPNKGVYDNICSMYDIKPNKKVSELLSKLTSKIKTEGD